VAAGNFHELYVLGKVGWVSHAEPYGGPQACCTRQCQRADGRGAASAGALVWNAGMRGLIPVAENGDTNISGIKSAISEMTSPVLLFPRRPEFDCEHSIDRRICRPRCQPGRRDREQVALRGEDAKQRAHHEDVTVTWIGCDAGPREIYRPRPQGVFSVWA
jgi:hypothetical protein